MKVTAVLGSPRKKGVTSSIAANFVKKAEKLGAQVAVHHLNRMEFKGCQGCHLCKAERENCVLKDDLTKTLEDIKESDLVLLATPVYYWDVSGQFKCFFDRTWSFVKPDYKTNPDFSGCMVSGPIPSGHGVWTRSHKRIWGRIL